MLFASDVPLTRPDRWLKDFRSVNFRPEGHPLILKENAVTLPGLSD